MAIFGPTLSMLIETLSEALRPSVFVTVTIPPWLAPEAASTIGAGHGLVSGELPGVHVKVTVTVSRYHPYFVAPWAALTTPVIVGLTGGFCGSNAPAEQVPGAVRPGRALPRWSVAAHEAAGTAPSAGLPAV